MPQPQRPSWSSWEALPRNKDLVFRLLPTRLLHGITRAQIKACETGAQSMQLLQSLDTPRKGLFLWLLELVCIRIHNICTTRERTAEHQLAECAARCSAWAREPSGAERARRLAAIQAGI